MSKKTMFQWSKQVLLGLGVTISASAMAAPYEWNKTAPVKIPAAGAENGKTILFDVSHGGVEGNADWVINGAFSDFADALQQEGYRVEEYRGIDLNDDGIIRFYDDVNHPENTTKNEAIITYDAIRHADVFVLAETNRPFKKSEYQALEQFIAAGKGIFFIADHYNADRNLNTWDATEVFNGHNRSTLNQFNYGGEYGDLRNPGEGYGWLVDHFGIRFRFNGVDFKQGASGIEAPENVEGLTEGVTPVLMAAGATLSIVDPTKAKGLVYFSEQDAPTAWRHAVDEGLYFGGREEGPYVAISKSGAGKAAFIGDSSPIEDQTPLYRRQDNGRVKKTYPGWTDTGNAAQLSINLINWLATPESYTHFDNATPHKLGEVTPFAKATVERDDPDNGNPWTQPSGGFNPWESDTYAKGSYGAPDGLGDSQEPPPATGTLSVTEALQQSNGTKVTVEGTITSSLNDIYALVLSDSNNTTVSINVKLESSQRSEFSPKLNPSILNHRIRVIGVRNNYLSQPGIRNVSEITDLGVGGGNGGDNDSGNGDGGSDDNDPSDNSVLSVKQALNEPNGSQIVLKGRVTSELNDIYALLLSDENDASSTINIKLESSQRNEFSPKLNPDILGNLIQIEGTRNDYLSQPGVRSVTKITNLNQSQNP